MGQHLSSIDARGQAVGIAFQHSPHLDDLKRRFPARSMLVLEGPGEAGARSA